MRKIIAAEFMTIDGVIQNEEANGDGGRGAGAAGKADGSAVGAKDLRRVGNEDRLRRFTTETPRAQSVLGKFVGGGGGNHPVSP